MPQAIMKAGPCQVRSKTESPCLHQAVVQILGIPFCEACAREQERYFAIGELTQEESQGLRSKPLDGMRRQQTDDLAEARRLDLRSVDDRRPNKVENVTEDARAMIRAAQEIHTERHGAQTFLPGTRLSFLEAASRTGIRTDRQRYYDAIDDLEYEGTIEWDKSARYARGDKHYLITQRGLHELGSAGTVAIQGSQQKLFAG